jgi:protein O-mannosyl-transferase
MPAGEVEREENGLWPGTRYEWLFALFILLSSVLTYWPTFDAGFVWDDRAAIMGNPDVVGDTEWHDVFGHDFWGKNIASPHSHKSYRPFCVLTFRWNYDFFGLEAGGYHICNAILHGLTCVTFYAYTRTLLHFGPAAIAATIFALHPVHTEAVAGLVGRADIVACFFMLLALMAYAKASKVQRALQSRAELVRVSLWVGAAVCCAVVSALFKEIGATVMGLMVAYEIFFVIRPVPTFKTPSLDSGLRIGIICTLTAVLLKLRLSLHEDHAIRRWTIMENHIGLSDSFKTRALTVAKTHGRYASMLVWPKHLSYDHGYNATPYVESFHDPALIEPLCAYIAVVCFGIYALVSENAVLRFSIALALVPFIPAMNIFFYVGTVLAERLLYIPSMGFCILAGIIIYAPFSNEVGSDLCVAEDRMLPGSMVGLLRRASRRFRLPIGIGFGVIVCLMASGTYTRNLDWQDESSIYEAGYREEPESVKVLNNLAQVLLRSGDANDAQRASELLTKAIRLNPQNPSAYYNLGLAYSTLTRRDEAIRYMKMAVSMEVSGIANCYGYLAQEYMHKFYALRHMGFAGDPQLIESARQASELAIKHNSRMPLVYFTAANIANEQGRLQDALDHYVLTLEMNKYKYLEPGTELNEADVRNQYGLSLASGNRVNEALAQWDLATGLEPNKISGSVNAAVLLSDIGRKNEALEKLLEATKIEPANGVVWNNMGSIADDMGDTKMALKHYEQALAYLPGHQTVQNNVNNMRAKLQWEQQQEERKQPTPL